MGLTVIAVRFWVVEGGLASPFVSNDLINRDGCTRSIDAARPFSRDAAVTDVHAVTSREKIGSGCF